jgi:hypothetical protein
MKGIGTDEDAIISVVGARTCAELKQVELAFKTFYGKDLMKDLNSEISGRFLQIVTYRFMTLAEFDAHNIRKAVEGAGTDEHALIEIFATRTNEQVKAAKEAYKRLFNRDIEKDIMGDTSGHFKRLLVSLLQGNRDESGRTDPAAAKTDAQALYDAGVGKMGTDESKFNQILASRGFPQLNLIFDEYRKIAGHDMEKALDKEMSGNLESGMLAVVKAARNRPDYFAERLYKAMKGAGTDDRALSRIIVSRCEIDMLEIKQAFQRKYGKSLSGFIHDDTSGDYKKILMKMVGP